MTEEDKIIEAFCRVRELGFVDSKRSHNTGIGKTFEDYIGVVENNEDGPDLYGYEIKSHRERSGSYVTLFSKVLSPSGANRRLRDMYGTQENGTMKLYTSMFGNRHCLFNDSYRFGLDVDKDAERLYIAVYNKEDTKLIEREAYYTFGQIQSALKKKMKNLFYVSAQVRQNGNTEQFYYHNAHIYSDLSVDRFMDCIENGDIMYDIRIGYYQSGPKMGKFHDHGCAFRIREENITKLFDRVRCI